MKVKIKNNDGDFFIEGPDCFIVESYVERTNHTTGIDISQDEAWQDRYAYLDTLTYGIRLV